MGKQSERDLGIFKKYHNLLTKINPNFIKNLIDETNKIDGWLCNYQIPLMWSIFSTLKSGGIICGHDYPEPNQEGAGFEELAKAVNEEVRDSDHFNEFSWLWGIWGAYKK